VGIGILLSPSCGNAQALFECPSPAIASVLQVRSGFSRSCSRSKYSTEIQRWYSSWVYVFITFTITAMVSWRQTVRLSGQEHPGAVAQSGTVDRGVQYVIDRAPRDFPLLPEILTRKGENLFKLRRAPEGVRALFQAIELKPDYWPPYAHISDYYKSLGEIAKARELLGRVWRMRQIQKRLSNAGRPRQPKGNACRRA